MRCVRSTDQYPNATLVAMPSLSSELSRRIAGALLSANPVGEDRYHWSLTTDYNKVDELYRTLRLGPYRYLREWTLKRFFDAYWPFLLAFAVLLVSGAAHLWRVETLVKRRTEALEEEMERRRKAELAAERAESRFNALQRSSVVGMLSSIFAHDLGQPLSAMRYALRGLETLLRRSKTGEAREGDDERIAECLKTLRAQLGRSADMIERVRSYAKRRDGRENPVDLKKVAREVVNEVGQSKSSRTAVTLELPEEETVVEGNGLELFLLLLNLLKNAQRATEEAKASSPVRVRLIRTSEKIRLTVENDGRPLSEEEVAKLGYIGLIFVYLCICPIDIPGRINITLLGVFRNIFDVDASITVLSNLIFFLSGKNIVFICGF